MPLAKDDIDAVSMMLHVNGELTFSILLTRGGLTQRLGSSDGTRTASVMVKGRTDRCFEDLLATLPDSVLEGGGDFEDGGRDGPRHDWKFELGGGLESLSWQIAYHQGSASLPDEFADMVVQAERLTHSWYLAGVAEETGEPLAVPSAPAPPVPRATAAAPKGRTASAAPPRSSGGVAARRPAPGQGDVQKWPVASRERISLAVLLDFFVLGVPYAGVRALLPEGEFAAPPGAGLVIFAFVEFALLYFLRRSVGYWMLGLRAPLGSSPRVDPAWPVRDSSVTMTVGALLVGSGAGGLVAWTLGPAPMPYFGLSLGAFSSTVLTLLFAVPLLAAGVLVLRTDLRGVWIGGGAMALVLVAVLLGWEPPLLYLLALVPAAFLVGLGLTWKRFSGRQGGTPRPAATAR